MRRDAELEEGMWEPLIRRDFRFYYTLRDLCQELGYRLDKEADNITLSEIAKSVSNDYIHVTWHNGEDGREAIKDSKVEQAIDSIFVDLNEACDNLLKDKTIEDIMNISK